MNTNGSNKLFLKSFIFLIAMIIGSLGMALTTVNNIGNASMGMFFHAAALKLGFISTGTMQTIFNCVFLVVGWIAAKDYMGIGSFLQTFTMGFFVDFWMWVASKFGYLFDIIEFKALFAVLGLVLFCFGNGLSASMRLGLAGYEVLLFKLSDVAMFKYKYVKMSSDALFFLFGFLLGGQFGVMTIAFVLLVGPLNSFFIVNLNRTLWKRWGIDDSRNELNKNKRGKFQKAKAGAKVDKCCEK